jgi:hypothetical protein
MFIFYFSCIARETDKKGFCVILIKKQNKKSLKECQVEEKLNKKYKPEDQRATVSIWAVLPARAPCPPRLPTFL